MSLVKIGSASNSSSSSQKQIKDKSLYIKTFGCQMNIYDSDKLAKILEDDYSLVDSPQSADLILVNTCSVRDKPEQKLYSLLGSYQDLKNERPELMIGVGGCVAQQEGKNIIKRSKLVDFVFGTHNLSLVPGLIEQRQGGAEPQVSIDYREDWEDLPIGIVDGSRTSVFVSISRGCNKNCTYCIVPTTRGKEVSRALDEILREVKISVHRGAKEVVLLGQTVNSWGRDLKDRKKFVYLLEEVAAVEGLHRIRFTSPHPQEVKEDFYELVANNPKVCEHIHMPLQAGNDRILKLMNRNYRSDRYLKIIAGLKASVPNIGLTTDVIVGFPGETESEFQDTLAVMREVEFDSCYSYMFSPRPGTKAVDLPDHLPHEIKLDRLQRLQVVQDEITARKLKNWIGQITEVLIDKVSPNKPNVLQGRNSQNIMVTFDRGDTKLVPGDFVKIKVSDSHRSRISGEVLAD